MKKLTDRQWAELEALNELTDDQIDYSDIPEITGLVRSPEGDLPTLPDGQRSPSNSTSP